MPDQETQTPFDGPQLQDEYCDSAIMTGSHFDGVNLTNAKLFVIMTRVSFTDANLGLTEFHNVNLGDARFNNNNMAGVTITNANLCQLSIDEALLVGAQFQTADLTGMAINGVLVADLSAVYGQAKS